MAKVKLENVHKVFTADEAIPLPGLRRERTEKSNGVSVALDGVNLLVRHGETLTVLGPSGCGKSTLLRVVAGLVPYEGHVYFDDRLVDGLRPSERNIGMVFQNYALYPQFSGRENLRFTFFVRKRPREEANERIRITSEVMGIGFESLLEHKPGVLSGGEQQRIAVGRALVRDPDIFLFDEPLSNLDAKLRVSTRSEMKRLLERFGHTAIYVTHDQMEATAIGDRLAVMRAGRVVQSGSYATLFTQPINTFVAGFLGSPPMTLLHGALNERGVWQLGGLEIPVPSVVTERLPVGASLILGIRPEHTHFAADEPPALSGQVVHIERNLSRRVQTLFVRHENLCEIAATISSDIPVHVGDRVPLVLARDHLVFFDGKTELRIG